MPCQAITVGKSQPAMLPARTAVGPVDGIAMVGDNPASEIEGVAGSDRTTMLVDPSGALRDESPSRRGLGPT
jgi:hypothetical protein